MRSSTIVPLAALAILLSPDTGTGGGVSSANDSGRSVAEIRRATPRRSPGRLPAPAPGTILVDVAGRPVPEPDAAVGGSRLPAGRYFRVAAVDVSGAAGGSFVGSSGDSAVGPAAAAARGTAAAALFLDGTLEFLPLEDRDLGGLARGDVNGDGREDIVFAIAGSDCDSIPGTTPRVWIRGAGGRFSDETASRMPPVSTSTFDIDLFDAEGDGDLDILLGGYSCASLITPATLLVNDGTGVFADLTASRLNAVPEAHLLYRVEPAPFDDDPHPDIAAILINLNRPSDPVFYPFLFLNDGTGSFWPDNQGRLLDYGSYGFFDLTSADLTGDGLRDLLFLNIASVGDTLDGRLALFRNTGDGFLLDETALRLGGDSLRRTRDVAIGDVDGDGDPDILDVGFFYGANVPQVRLLVNQGSGLYAASTDGAIGGLAGWFNDGVFAPLKQDTLPDLFLAKVRVGEPDYDRLLVNDGSGGFIDSSVLLPGVFDFSVAAAPGDADGDTDVDLFVGNSAPVVNQGGQNRLYLNQRRSPPVSVGGDPFPSDGPALLRNYPNPFNGATTIPFRLDRAAGVSLTAANLLGQVVWRHAAGFLPPGGHAVRWETGSLPGGVYLITLRAGEAVPPARAALLIR